MSLQDYVRILRRRRAIILQAFVLISVLGLCVTLLTKPVYQANAKLLVDTPVQSVSTVDANNPLSSLFTPGQVQTVDTQVEVLQTQQLLDQVVRQTGPATLTVQQVKDTNVIEATAEAATPQRAAAAANALFQIYLNQSDAQDTSKLENTRVFVQGQLQQAGSSLAKAEARMSAFRQQNHLADLDQDRTDAIGRVSALTDTDQKAQGDLAVLRAQIVSEQALLAQQPAAILVSLQASNTTRSDLMAQIDRLNVQKASITQKGGYTSMAPPVLALDAQIKTLRGQIARQPALITTMTSSPNSVKDTLRNSLVTLEAQEAALSAKVASLARQRAMAQAQVDRFAGWDVAQAGLARQRDAARASYNNFQAELSQITLRERAHRTSAQVIESALPPNVPVRPKKAQSILFACLIGLFVGICLALLLEFLDDTINTAEDASRVLGIPLLGRVPDITVKGAYLLPQMRSLDPVAESYRVLRTNIQFSSIDAPVRTLLVTSAAPQEGKTTTAANLAFAMAMDGKRVILVDADLRRPTVHALLGMPPAPGLTDVLLGKTVLDNALLDDDDTPGLSALAAGSVPPNPAELLNSRRFRSLVVDLTERADIVIFDSPPLLSAADAQILASQMDGTVLVIETGRTKKAEARQALGLLHQSRANVLGLTYNRMRPQENRGYYNYRYNQGKLTEVSEGECDAKPRFALEAPERSKQ